MLGLFFPVGTTQEEGFLGKFGPGERPGPRLGGGAVDLRQTPRDAAAGRVLRAGPTQNRSAPSHPQ